jgi:hypothetical protein
MCTVGRTLLPLAQMFLQQVATFRLVCVVVILGHVNSITIPVRPMQTAKNRKIFLGTAKRCIGKRPGGGPEGTFKAGGAIWKALF